MQAILLYLLKATVCSCILFLYYCIALRNKRFHYYNRFYLLMSVVLSLLVPLPNFTLWQFESNNQHVIQLMNVVAVNTSEVNETEKAFTFSWSGCILLCYVFITLSMLVAFLYNLKKLNDYKYRYPSERLGKILFINTDLAQAPFSFFNNLFWKNTLDIDDTTGRQVFRHELTHIEQKHSWDKLFLRLTTLVFWMNPFYWLIQKELSLIHEFIADEKAIENRSAEAFALVLLKSQYGKNIFSPAQSFNYSPIKRRLLMLTTSAKTSYTYARRILVLPLLAGTILLFAFKLRETKQPSTILHTNAPFTLLIDAGHGGSVAGAVGLNGITEKDINLAIAKKVQVLAPAYGITIKMTRNEDLLMDPKARMDIIETTRPDAFISIHVNTTGEQQTNKNEINVYIPRNEANSNFPQSRLLGSSLLQEAKRDFSINTVLMQRKEEGIYVVDQNPYPAALIECGYINNADNVRQLQDAAKIEQLAGDILQGVVAYANASKQTFVVQTDTAVQPPLYLLDGKEISKEETKSIDANTIQSVSVLKGEEAVAEYGEKGKNGVVIITSKKVNDKGSKKAITIKESASNNSTDKALKVVDGKIVTDEELNKVDPKDIESINVLKGESAVGKYGKKGSNGVVEVTTKKKSS